VIARGDNHQTIQAASDEKKAIGIMEGFIHRFEPLNSSSDPSWNEGFDAVIDLDPTAETRQNLETVVAELHNQFPKLFADMPSSEDLDEAITFALSDYKPDLRHAIPDRKSRNDRHGNQKQQQQQQAKEPRQPPIVKKRPLEYISVTLPKNEILEALDTAFDSVSSQKARFFKQLQQTRRVQPEFHVTLIHRASSKTHPDLWAKYSDIHALAGHAENKLGDCKVLLERIVWDDRIMAIVARLVDEEWECTNEVAHVTVGTRGPEVKPKESNDLLKRWLSQGSGDESGIGEVVIDGRQVINGTVKGVLSRPSPS